MRTWARLLQGGAVLAAGIVLVSTALKSQAPPRPAATLWEYSAVIDGQGPDFSYEQTTFDPQKSYNMAHICYSAVNGCRSETLIDVVDRQDKANQPNATLKAAAELGSQGWELVSATGEARGATLYFRRPKR
jgi:hypothetical protein